MVAVVSTRKELRALVNDLRAAGKTIGLVPTMGALHAGHASLVKASASACAVTIASIFVNPKQFGPNEDLARYPRTLEADLRLLEEAGAQYAYVPDVAQMYPDAFATNVHVAGASEGLCGSARPTHFDGVATVVTKLLLQAQPHKAFFGEKDFQQLKVIQRLVEDLDIPAEIVSCPIVREGDGLAMSSRNRYLETHERAIAPKLYNVLKQTAEAIRFGSDIGKVLDDAAKTLVAAGFTRVDYVELRESQSLLPIEQIYRSPARLLAAVWIGTTRLIDNVSVEGP